MNQFLFHKPQHATWTSIFLAQQLDQVVFNDRFVDHFREDWRAYEPISRHARSARSHLRWGDGDQYPTLSAYRSGLWWSGQRGVQRISRSHETLGHRRDSYRLS